MFILSINCAGSGCGVCVWRDGTVLVEISENMERGQDQRLMPMIMEAMQRAKVEFKQLDRIAVVRGPGSFTGIRIALAAARGIGLASEKPVVGIDRFSIYRELHLSNPNTPQLVVINSRRKELYCRFYPADGAAQDMTMMTAKEIAAFLKGKPDTIISGDIDPAIVADCQSADEPEHVVAARLAAKADPKNPEFLARPLYIRAPDVTQPRNKSGLHLLSIDQAPLLAALHAESSGKIAWSRQQIQSSLALDTTRGWGMFESGNILGFILCQLIPDQAEILAFCVHPTHRRTGLGEKLLHAAVRAARECKSNLYLEVAQDNAGAIALYEKTGFIKTGYRPRYYHIGDRAVDAVLYTLPSLGADLPRG